MNPFKILIRLGQKKRHDACNALSILYGFNGILRDRIEDPEIILILEKQQRALDRLKQILLEDCKESYDDDPVSKTST
jgi:hypothetical protein